MLLAGSIIVIGLGGCAKEKFTPFPSTPIGLTPPAQHVQVNLVADNWVNSGNGIYVNTFGGVLSNLPITGGNSLKVYVQDGDEVTVIGRSPAMFKGHEMWITNTRTDLALNYECGDKQLPFGTLHVVLQVN